MTMKLSNCNLKKERHALIIRFAFFLTPIFIITILGAIGLELVKQKGRITSKKRSERKRIPLPPSLERDYASLMVDRKGRGDDAVQVVQEIIGFVDNKQTYQLTLKGLLPTNAFQTNRTTNTIKVAPKCPKEAVVFKATWSDARSSKNAASNLLGKSGSLVVKHKTVLTIPSTPTTQEHLSFYGAELYELGDNVTFPHDDDQSNPKPLAVALAYIGQNYTSGYLLQPDLGGGAYIERHDLPHVYMPAKNTAGGYLILAKRKRFGRLQASAFQIPFGYAVYTRPNTLHCDSFLTGDYLAVFAATDDYRTGNLVDTNGGIMTVKIV